MSSQLEPPSTPARRRRVGLAAALMGALVLLSAALVVLVVRSATTPTVTPLDQGAQSGARVLQGPACIASGDTDTAPSGFDEQVSRDLERRVFQELPPDFKASDLASDVGPLSFQNARTADRDTADNQDSALDPHTLKGAHQKFFLTKEFHIVAILVMEFRTEDDAGTYLARRKVTLPQNAAPYQPPGIPDAIGYETGSEGRSEVVVRFRKGRRVARVDVVDNPQTAKTAARFISEGQCALM